MFRSYLKRNLDNVNNKVVEGKNKNDITRFLAIFKNLAIFNYFFKLKNTETTKKPHFLTFNISKIFNILK